MSLSKETFDLAKMLKHVRLAKHYAESICREKHIYGPVKERLKGVINRCNAAEREVLGGISAEARQVLESQLLDMETTGQLEAIQDMILEMPVQGREEVEAMVLKIHAVHSKTITS